MQNILKVSAVALAMVLSGLTVASAQQANEPAAPGVEEMSGRGEGHWGGHRGKEHGRHGMRGARMIDLNMDGVVSDEEASMIAERMFMRMDEDRNEALSEAEFTTPPRHGMRGWFGLGADEAQAVIDVRKARFVALDADKNASVSKAEFFADAKARLAAADADKDGKVTPWEFRAAPRE
jgi:hypothetical protein